MFGLFIILVLVPLVIPIFLSIILGIQKDKKLSRTIRKAKVYIVSIDKRETNEGYCYFLKEINLDNTFIAYGDLSNSTYGSVLEITVNGFDKVLEIIEIPNEIVGTCEVSEYKIIEKSSETSYILLDEECGRSSENIYRELFIVGDTIIKTKYLYEEGYSETFYKLKLNR